MPKTTANITGVSLCQKKGIIRIFRSTIKELGDPRYIRFLFNPEKRTLAVQSVSRDMDVHGEFVSVGRNMGMFHASGWGKYCVLWNV